MFYWLRHRERINHGKPQQIAPGGTWLILGVRCACSSKCCSDRWVGVQVLSSSSPGSIIHVNRVGPLKGFTGRAVAIKHLQTPADLSIDSASLTYALASSNPCRRLSTRQVGSRDKLTSFAMFVTLPSRDKTNTLGSWRSVLRLLMRGVILLNDHPLVHTQSLASTGYELPHLRPRTIWPEIVQVIITPSVH